MAWTAPGTLLRSVAKPDSYYRIVNETPEVTLESSALKDRGEGASFGPTKSSDGGPTMPDKPEGPGTHRPVAAYMPASFFLCLDTSAGVSCRAQPGFGDTPDSFGELFGMSPNPVWITMVRPQFLSYLLSWVLQSNVQQPAQCQPRPPAVYSRGGVVARCKDSVFGLVLRGKPSGRPW